MEILTLSKPNQLTNQFNYLRIFKSNKAKPNNNNMASPSNSPTTSPSFAEIGDLVGQEVQSTSPAPKVQDTDLSVADLVPPMEVPTDVDHTGPIERVERSTTPASDRSTPPPMVEAGTKSGVEPQAHELAKMFMAAMGSLARKCRTRGQLSELYLTTIASWATDEVQKDESKQRHFKQVLFAIAHGMKLVRVRDQGRSLFWNRYRDNQGNQLEDERAKFDQRREHPRDDGAHSDGHWQTAGPQRDQRRGGYQGDRRGGYQGDRRGGYQGDRRGGYQGDRRGDYQGDRRVGGGGGRRDGHRSQGSGEVASFERWMQRQEDQDRE